MRDRFREFKIVGGEETMDTIQKKKTFLERIANEFSGKMTEEQFRESFKLKNDDHNLSDILDRIPDFEEETYTEVTPLRVHHGE